MGSSAGASVAGHGLDPQRGLRHSVRMTRLTLKGLLVLVLLAGCAAQNSPNAIMDRVDANRDEYETWPIEIKEAVLSGRAVRGMTTKMVLVARGKPAEVVDHGNGDETWIYRNGGSSALGSGILSGTTVTIGGGGSGYPGNGYPGNGYPGSGYPGGGYPGGGYPGGGYPGSGYPSSGVGIYVPPIVLSGGGGGGNESVDDDEIVFKQGIVTHGDSPGG